MKSASFVLPYDALYKFLQDYLTRTVCTIVSAEVSEGTIKANCKKVLFHKPKTLDFTVKKLSEQTTSITLSVNSNQNAYVRPSNDDEFAEEELMDTINKYF